MHLHTNVRIISGDEGDVLRWDRAPALGSIPRVGTSASRIYERFMIQVGREPSDFKPLPGVGPGAYEIRVRDDAGAFRVIYVAKIERAVYVLHAFHKTTRKTRQADIQLAARRYKAIGDEP